MDKMTCPGCDTRTSTVLVRFHGEQAWVFDDVRGAATVLFDESDDPPKEKQ